MRRPAVAGLFYPDRADELEAELTRLVGTGAPAADARAVVVPHAGWRYSGRVAGDVYGRVRLPARAVVIGPNHTGRGPDGSVMARGRWALPGGALAIAEDLARKILGASRVLEEDDTAHAREHAVEVQLPFLRRLRPAVAFVPIVLMRDDPAFCDDVGRAVAAAIRDLAEPVVLVCSTDLNHYESDAVSRRKDRAVIDALLALDGERLRATVIEQDSSMCGLAPALATLAALRELGGGRAELVGYATSGDVSGDRERVVGYASLIVR